MKKIILSVSFLACMGLFCSTQAVEKAELEQRIRVLAAKLDAMQQKPERKIPAENLRKAQGIILLDRTKAGFIFAYQGGSGVALVKDPKTEKWGPIGFLTANEASLGFQVGGEQTFFAILLMTTNATRLLTEPKVIAGGEARGTAGNSSSVAEAPISPAEPAILVYDDRLGLYGGAAIKGGAVVPDDQANRIYYGQFLTMKDILFENKVPPTEGAQDLARKIESYSKSDLSSKR